MPNKVTLHYDPAQSLRCINYVLATIGTSEWREDIAKSFLLEAQAHLTKHAPDAVDSAASVSISTSSEVSASEAESNPTTTQVM